MLPRMLLLGILAGGAVLAETAQAKSGGNFGIGFMLGRPTALSAKYWTSQNTALDFGMGWDMGSRGWRGGTSFSDDRCYDYSFYLNRKGYCDDRAYRDGRWYGHRDRWGHGYGGFHFHMDYLFHNFNLIKATERIPVYYGPGMRVNLNYWDHWEDEVSAGFRGVVGMAWLPRKAPFDLFLELAPVLMLFPGTYMNFDLSLGSRFYF